MSERRYEYVIVDPGGAEDGRVVTFAQGTTPPMFSHERFQLADGRMVRVRYVGPVTT